MNGILKKQLFAFNLIWMLRIDSKMMSHKKIAAELVVNEITKRVWGKKKKSIKIWQDSALS